MNSPIVLMLNALCLTDLEVQALLWGQTIAAFPKKFIRPGQQFALGSSRIFQDSSSPKRSDQENSFNSQKADTLKIPAWAICEICRGEPVESLEKLAPLTSYTSERLQQIFAERSTLFLAILRVYRLPAPIEVSIDSPISDKRGKFIGLPQPIDITGSIPVLGDRLFDQRRQQLEKLEPPLHPELEEFQSLISQFSVNHPEAKKLDRDFRTFLGWSSDSTPQNTDPDFNWIHKIAAVGNSSDGHEFEKLVRRSFIKLGFSNSNPNPKISLDPNATGGAGGLDFYCESPYAVVGECKATKTEKVPDGTPAQLVKLGQKHLQHHYHECIKIVMAAGELTSDAEQTAKGNEMNVIRPETLQRLVELKMKYPGSIDLLKLKPCLETAPFGSDADLKVNEYIDRIESDIQVRSHLIQAVKTCPERLNLPLPNIDSIHAVYAMSNPPLPREEMREMLIELSSPLTGYLGRKKGKYWQDDRFYFLRDFT